MTKPKSVTVLVSEPAKRWLEAKAAERIISGRPHGERSISAVIVDLIEAARKREQGRAA